MSGPKTLDFSGLKEYEECPQRYKWNRLDRRKPQVKENSYYAISGITKQKLFEHFMNDRWYLKGKQCVPYMESVAAQYFEECLKTAHVDWAASIAKLTKEQMLEEIKSGVQKGINIIKAHRLVSGESKSEVRLVANIKNWFELVGKIDFIIRHPNENYIIDGKDTADPKRMQQVDPRQLAVYSLLHERNYGKYPDKVGFMFWRHDTVLYYDPKERVEEITEWAIKSYWDISKGKFEPKPSSSNCFFCKYKHECDAYKGTQPKVKDIPEGDEIGF